MELNTTIKDFENTIIINQGYCDKIYNFIYYDLLNKSDNYYNYGYYGWNWSIYELNKTFNKLRYNVYIINSYRNAPKRDKRIKYNEIEKYFTRIIKNYNSKINSISYEDIEKLRKSYINKITKKLNEIIDKSYNY